MKKSVKPIKEKGWRIVLYTNKIKGNAMFYSGMDPEPEKKKKNCWYR